MCQLDDLVIGDAAKNIGIGQVGKLIGHGLFDWLAGIPQIDVPQTANSVNCLMAIDISDMNAATRFEDHGQVGLTVGGMRHGMPQLAGVHFPQEIIVECGTFRHRLSPWIRPHASAMSGAMSIL